MKKESSSKPSKKIKKYPDIVYQSRAIRKAVSVLPASNNSKLPIAYVRALPMIVGVVTALLLVLLPTTRNSIVSFSQKTFDNFYTQTNQLKSEFYFSLKNGLDSYKNQISQNIKILPIDTPVEQEDFLGRSEIKYISKKEPKILAEKAHLLTASIYKSLDYFK